MKLNKYQKYKLELFELKATEENTFVFTVAAILCVSSIFMTEELFNIRAMNGTTIFSFIGLITDVFSKDLPNKMLNFKIDASLLDPMQKGVIQLAYNYPGSYKRFVVIYLMSLVIGFYFVSKFIYNLIIRPVRPLLLDKEILPEDVLFPELKFNQDELNLIVGLKHYRYNFKLKRKPEPIVIPFKSCVTGICVTGTTGQGKTYGALYSFTKQALFFNPLDPVKKVGTLILDVKGTYYKKVMEFAKEAGRQNDLVVIELGGKWKYNPLHKPDMLADEIAGRISEILEMKSGGKTGGDSFWQDNAKKLIANSIRLARLYSGYVSFKIIDEIIRLSKYSQMIEEVQEKEDCGQLSDTEIYEFTKVKTYFSSEIEQAKKDNAKVMGIILNEVNRMTAAFTNEKIVEDTFCPDEKDLNFTGFRETVDQGKIVVLAMNVKKYPELAPFIACYLKLDWQMEGEQRNTRHEANTTRPLVFICDEYHFMASKSDTEHFSTCRDSQMVNIVATQSYKSLIVALENEKLVDSILQNLVNQIWLRSDDEYTIEKAMKACGKVKKYKENISFSENAKNSRYSRLFGATLSNQGNLSQSISYSEVEEPRFTYDNFTLDLKVLKAIAKLSMGSHTDTNTSDMYPTVLHLIPYTQLNFHTEKMEDISEDQIKQLSDIEIKDDNNSYDIAAAANDVDRSCDVNIENDKFHKDDTEQIEDLKDKFTEKTEESDVKERQEVLKDIEHKAEDITELIDKEEIEYDVQVTKEVLEEDNKKLEKENIKEIQKNIDIQSQESALKEKAAIEAEELAAASKIKEDEIAETVEEKAVDEINQDMSSSKDDWFDFDV